MIEIQNYRNKVEFCEVISLNQASAECICGDVPVYEYKLTSRAKYAQKEYNTLKEQLILRQGKGFLVVYENDMLLANRLLWECDNLTGVLYVDGEDPYRPERLVESRDRILWNVQAGFSKESDKAFMSGWKNSYDNQLFSAEEIREYVDNTRMKLQAYLGEDKTALEIGCGSGMISDALAPLVKEYDGCDISDAVLEKLEQMNLENGICNMELHHLAADEIDRIGKKFHLILSSSVTEYFGGYNYLRNVVRKCVDCISDGGGVIYFGDVFDLELREQYIASVEQYSRLHPETKASNSFLFELFISPRFWYDLAATEDGIASVEISRKIGNEYNEINRFRYDVLLHVNREIKKKTEHSYLFKYQFAGRRK